MKEYEIRNCSEKDIPVILSLYQEARVLMQSKQQVVWPIFSESSIRAEIEGKQIWCILVDSEIGCIWSTAFSDSLIWGERDKQPSVYIHRIATNAKFRGMGFVSSIVDWAKIFALENAKLFVRMDTVGRNHALINHYQKYGFTFLGASPLECADGLPDHYKEGEVCYFEIEL